MIMKLVGGKGGNVLCITRQSVHCVIQKADKSVMQKATNNIQLHNFPKIITMLFCEKQTSIVIWFLF